jgi:hypothetical protein
MALKSEYERLYDLRGNPFDPKATYSEEKQRVYVREMFGNQWKEFMRKFVIAPLQNGQPVIGAVWSVVPNDPKARGFGKSTLMGEEAKLINRDFGKSTLMQLGISEKEAMANPILAGYVSFNVSGYGGINSINAAAFNLVRFLLRDGKTHIRLKEMAAARLVSEGKATPGDEGEAIISALKQRIRKLAFPIDVRNLLDMYVIHLASGDTDKLEQFLADEVGTWHHDRNGLKYLQIFVIFGELAGIEHFTFFIDQVEDFTSGAGAAKIQKNVKMIRDALIESEPFASRASFVFQLHPDAYEKLRRPWVAEELPALDWDDELNAPVVVVLKGLTQFATAKLLAEKILNHEEFATHNHKGIKPFTEKALELVLEATKPKPRDYLRVLHQLLRLGKEQHASTIDDAFVKPKIARILTSVREEEEGELVEDHRLA